MGIKISGTDQAKILSQLIMDYADYNYTQFEAFSDTVPEGAKEFYDKAKALNDYLNKENN